MVDNHSDLMPSWLLVNSRAEIAILGTPWSDEREKQLARNFLRLKMRELNVVAYSFITEAWTATAPKSWQPESGEAMPEKEQPRNRADRQEIVIAFATDGKTKAWRQWDIQRDWHEQVVALKETDAKEAEIQSWMANLLD